MTDLTPYLGLDNRLEKAKDEGFANAKLRVRDPEGGVERLWVHRIDGRHAVLLNIQLADYRVNFHPEPPRAA